MTVQGKIKKGSYKIIIIALLLFILIIALAGCGWFSLGLWNIFDPQAQITVTCTKIDLTEDKIELEIYSLNQVGFNGEGFEYEYKFYEGKNKVDSLTKTVGRVFFVAASSGPGVAGEITTVSDLPLYYQDAQDYISSYPLVTEMTCSITLIGTDTAGHSIFKSVTVDLPALEPGVDFTLPTAFINVTPGTTGTAPFTVVFDASGSTDDRGIASYSWDFGDNTSGTGILTTHKYSNPGTYIVILTVTDYFGNEGYDMITITVEAPEEGEGGCPS